VSNKANVLLVECSDKNSKEDAMFY